MRYDLELLREACRELGFEYNNQSEHHLKVHIGRDVFLIFYNEEKKDDCGLGFEGTPWHTHGDLMFDGTDGTVVDLSYLDLLEEMAKGRVLVCETIIDGHLKDRWLTHAVYNDELEYMESNEEIRIWRANVEKSSKIQTPRH